MPTMNVAYIDGTEKTCAVCGKKFNCIPEYVYKETYGSKLYWFCRYNHQRDWERKKAEIDKKQAILRKRLARYYKTKDPAIKAMRKEEIDQLKEEMKSIEGFPIFNYGTNPAADGDSSISDTSSVCGTQR